jgi:lysophospholipase L1-like esterase
VVAAVALVVVVIAGLVVTVGDDPVVPAAASVGEAGRRGVVLGDSYAEGSGADRVGGGYVQTFAAAMGWKVEVDAQGGTGYFAPGPPTVDGLPSNRTSLVERSTRRLTPDRINYVMVSAGINDRTPVEDERLIPAAVVGQRADLTFANLLAAYPGARLIVVGPFWPNDDPTAGMLAVRDEIERAAARHGALFIDPIAEQWITRENMIEMISADGTHPTQAGHDYMAYRLMEGLRRAGVT